MSYKYVKRGIYRVRVRWVCLNIKTTDNVIVPTICKLFRKSVRTSLHKKFGPRHLVNFTPGQLRLILPKIIPYLYIKQPHAQLCQQALNIKAGNNTPYSQCESKQWDEIFHKIKLLNIRGHNAHVDNYQRNHKFTWAWLAGLIDGDGSITITAWRLKDHIIQKPTIKISLTHLGAIEYLSGILGIRSIKSGKMSGNRRPCRAVRLMSGKIIDIAPKIIPHLKLKKKSAELAYEIALLRRNIPNGQYNHPNVARCKELIKQLRQLTN